MTVCKQAHKKSLNVVSKGPEAGDISVDAFKVLSIDIWLYL